MALGAATPKAELHKDFREEVITGGSVTMKLFVQLAHSGQ